ncbi:hypothetical protein SB758_39730, partial [Burkholderia sp. SIMBA_013]
VDRIGAWRAVLVYSLLLPVGVGILYASLINGGVWLGAAYALAGLSCGVVGAVPSVMVGLNISLSSKENVESGMFP